MRYLKMPKNLSMETMYEHNQAPWREQKRGAWFSPLLQPSQVVALSPRSWLRVPAIILPFFPLHVKRGTNPVSRQRWSTAALWWGKHYHRLEKQQTTVKAEQQAWDQKGENQIQVQVQKKKKKSIRNVGWKLKFNVQRPCADVALVVFVCYWCQTVAVLHFISDEKSRSSVSVEEAGPRSPAGSTAWNYMMKWMLFTCYH